MGLLTQALAGGFSAAANTGSALIQQQMKYDHESELEKAREIKAMNLARFNADYQAARDDKRYEQQNARDDAKDKRLQDSEQRKLDATLTDYVDESGIPLTRAEIIAAKKTKQAGEDAERTAQSRSNDEFVKESLADGLNELVPDAKTQVADAMGVPRKPKSLINSKQPEYNADELKAIEKAEKVQLQSSKQIAEAQKRAELAAAKEKEILLKAAEDRKTKIETTKMMGDIKKEVAKSKGGGKADTTDKKDMAVRLRDAQRGYNSALKSGDPDAINAAIDTIESLNDLAESAGTTPQPVPKRPRTSAEIAQEKKDLTEAWKAEHPIKSKFVSPSGKDLEEIKSKGLINSKPATKQAASSPKMEQWLTAAKAKNPNVSEEELKAYYNKKYGR